MSAGRGEHIPSPKLTARPWKWMVGKLEYKPFLLGNPIFRCELLVSGRVKHSKFHQPPPSYAALASIKARMAKLSMLEASNFRKDKHRDFFSAQKNRVISFPTGRDHIILPYLCEYHVISWCISWCISPTLSFLSEVMVKSKCITILPVFFKGSVRFEPWNKTDLKSFRVQRRFLQFAGISEWYSWWFRNPQKPVEHG